MRIEAPPYPVISAAAPAAGRAQVSFGELIEDGRSAESVVTERALSFAEMGILGQRQLWSDGEDSLAVGATVAEAPLAAAPRLANLAGAEIGLAAAEYETAFVAVEPDAQAARAESAASPAVAAEPAAGLQTAGRAEAAPAAAAPAPARAASDGGSESVELHAGPGRAAPFPRRPERPPVGVRLERQGGLWVAIAEGFEPGQLQSPHVERLAVLAGQQFGVTIRRIVAAPGRRK
jgi:hypothetical protein